MITVVTGKIGRGKSFYMTTRIVSHLLRGGVVATNMDIQLDYIRAHWHRSIYDWQLVPVDAADDPKKIPRGDFRGSSAGRRVMVVLDEALNWFASSPGAKDERKATWGEWLRQSDKLGQDVFFIAQSFERSAKWLRELAQIAINCSACKDLTLLRIPLGRLPFLRNLYTTSEADVSSQMLLRWNVRYFDPAYYKAYKTSQLFGFDASDSAYISSIPPAFSLPFWPFLVPVFLFLLGVIYAAR